MSKVTRIYPRRFFTAKRCLVAYLIFIAVAVAFAIYHISQTLPATY